MGFYDLPSVHVPQQVSAGGNIITVNGLKSGTLYAAFVRAKRDGLISTYRGATTQGSGISLLGTLSTDATNLQAQIKQNMGVTAPASYFVAGADANLSRYYPQVSIDYGSSTDTRVAVRVAAPDFNTPLDANVAALRCLLSTDGGNNYASVTEIAAPFEAGTTYATFYIDVPYDKDIYAVFQVRFKDGTCGRASRPVQFFGVPAPTALPLAAPNISGVTGFYNCDQGKVLLNADVTVEADPDATDVLVQFYNGSTQIQSVSKANVPGQSVVVRVSGLDSSVGTYTVNAFSVKTGIRGAAATTTWSTSGASPLVVSKFSPVSSINLSEVIANVAGVLTSSIRVQFSTLLNPNQPKGNVYVRKKDGTALASLTKASFTLMGSSTTGDITVGAYTTQAATAGAGVVYQVVILAVAPNGAEADYSSDQVLEVGVVQYANYVPLQQAVPTITVLSPTSVRLDGTYVRPAGTPEPLELRAYNSETSTAAANLVATAKYTRIDNAGTYTYSLTITNLTPYSVGSGNFDITLRAYLENGGITTNATKTTMRVTQALPATPVMSTAQAFVKTVVATITNATAFAVGSQQAYTPSSGNGGKITLTAAADTLKAEVSDSGTPGTNPVVVQASVDIVGSLVTAIFTPSNNSGARNVRFKWVTTYGDTAWSNAIQVTFPAQVVVDTTCDVSTCLPRFTCNADGTVTITWTAGNFGSAGAGAYTIYRSTASTFDLVNARPVGTVTNTLSFTDMLPVDLQEKTYYYYLDAKNAQGNNSTNGPVAVKLQSGNTYATETNVAAASHRTTPPSTPSGLTVTGGQGGFNIIWSAVPERVKDYRLDWSAIGDFTDTVTVYVSGSTYFQVAGATVPVATANNYKWRIYARDYSGVLSTVSASVTSNNTNYGSVQDSAPTAPGAVTLVANSDGSITINGLSSTAPYFHIKRLASSSTWTPATSGTADNAKVQADEIIDGSCTTYRDTGLNPNLYYTYQVFTRSKLGTDSATFAAPPAPVQAQYVVQGVMRRSLIVNGHFGTAQGAYGTSYNGWTLGSGAAASYNAGIISVSSTSYSVMQFTKSATSAVLSSQTFQVVPGKKYTVMGMLYYNPITLDGNAYLRISPTVALSDASNGATTLPAPYSSGTGETSGTDVTTVRKAWRVITYSFTAPANVTAVTLNIGFENRTASDGAAVLPGFIQVYCES